MSMEEEFADNMDHMGDHDTSFADLGLKPELLQSILDAGLENPTNVQRKCIPQAMKGLDFLCRGAPREGKTLVFILSILQQIEPIAGQIHALILCSTRELAFQTSEEFKKFTKYFVDIKVSAIFGGVKVRQQKEMLQTDCPNIVVGTPGRLLALARDRTLSLVNIGYLVIDDCEKVLSQNGMLKEFEKIFDMTPRHKQVMMFSSTMDKEMAHIYRKFTCEPVKILIDNMYTINIQSLTQYHVQLPNKEKQHKLQELLIQFDKVLVFVNTVKTAQWLDEKLNRLGYQSACIHSDLSQEERMRRYLHFTEESKNIIISTDIFSRGLDFEDIDVVVNFHTPHSIEDYFRRAHKARRGSGMIISFVSSYLDLRFLKQVEESYGVDILQLPKSLM